MLLRLFLNIELFKLETVFFYFFQAGFVTIYHEICKEKSHVAILKVVFHMSSNNKEDIHSEEERIICEKQLIGVISRTQTLECSDLNNTIILSMLPFGAMEFFFL